MPENDSSRIPKGVSSASSIVRGRRGKAGAGMRIRLSTGGCLIAALLLAGRVRAEQAASPSGGDTESDTELAKKTQNPVADLISVPFQHNFNFDTGPEQRTVGDLGKLPVNVSLQGYGNAVKPDFAADWQLRFQIQFLFPK